jgi:hypothetical protein
MGLDIFDKFISIFTGEQSRVIDTPEVVGLPEPGQEEHVVSDWSVIAEKEYDEASTYSGPAFRTSIKFKGARIVSLKPDWLLSTVIWGESKKADIVPLKAVIKERRINTPFIGSIISEYELIFHYHDSPAILCIASCIAGVLIAAGFLILATKAPEAEQWIPTIKGAADTAKNLAAIFKWGVIGVGGFWLLGQLGSITGGVKQGIKALKG